MHVVEREAAHSGINETQECLFQRGCSNSTSSNHALSPRLGIQHVLNLNCNTILAIFALKFEINEAYSLSHCI